MDLRKVDSNRPDTIASCQVQMMGCCGHVHGYLGSIFIDQLNDYRHLKKGLAQQLRLIFLVITSTLRMYMLQ